MAHPACSKSRRGQKLQLWQHWGYPKPNAEPTFSPSTLAVLQHRRRLDDACKPRRRLRRAKGSKPGRNGMQLLTGV